MACRSLFALTPLIASLFLQSASANFTFNTTFDSRNNGQIGNPAEQLKVLNATEACLTAFVANIDCDPILFNFTLNPSETLYTQSNLEKACTSTCEHALASWIVNTFDACQNQPAAVTLFDPKYHISEDLYMLMYYRSYCTQDLTNGTFCLLEQDPVTLDSQSTYTPAEIAVACNDTCFTQNSAVMWNTYGALNNTDGINMENVATVCPNVDTSKYEVLEPVSALAASATTSSSSSTSSGGSTTTSAGAGTTGTGSATTTTTGTGTQTQTGASTSKTPNNAASVSRGGLPVALMALAVAVAL